MEEPKKPKIDSESTSFQEEWTDLYFFVQHDDKPTCLICKETVSACRENSLKRHYESKHEKKYGTIVGASRHEKILKLRQEVKSSHKKKQESEAELRATYQVAHILSRDLRPFSDGECVKKCMLAIMDEMYPEKRNAFKSISLSTMTLTKRMEEMGENLHSKLKSKAARFEMFSVAVDESTDAQENVRLLVFIRGTDSSFRITEELAAVRCIRGSVTPDGIFGEISAVLEDHGLPWNKLVGVTTNGAKTMVGCPNGLAGKIKSKVVESNGAEPVLLHSIIHQQNVCSKVLRLDHVMKVVVNIVNYIRTQASCHKRFKELLADIESEYEDAVSGHEGRWFGRGKVIRRIFDLRHEIELFITEKSTPVTKLKDPSWVWDLAFLCDVTSHLNELRSKLQEKEKFISHLYADVTAFQAKLQLFIHQAGKASLVHFPTCATLRQGEHKTSFFPKPRMIHLLSLLKDNFNKRFSEFENLKEEIRLFENPFVADVSHSPADLQMELIDLQSRTALLDKFRTMDLVEFYSELPPETFPKLRQLALKLITMFTSTHVCEEALTMMKRARSVRQNRLSNEHLDSVLRIGVSSINPDIKKMVSRMVSTDHSSHSEHKSKGTIDERTATSASSST